MSFPTGFDGPNAMRRSTSIDAVCAAFEKDKAVLTPHVRRRSFTFASPRVGDRTFANIHEALQFTSWRIDDAPDIVPDLSPTDVDDVHVAVRASIDSRPYAMDTVSVNHSLPAYRATLAGQVINGNDCPPNPAA